MVHFTCVVYGDCLCVHSYHKGDNISLSFSLIDLVSIDPQSVGKRTHDLMDTVNAKKRWTTIYWRVNNFLAT
jgi:hypothetical protein